MRNKQCKECDWYNSLACPYAGSDWKEGEECDEYRPAVKEALYQDLDASFVSTVAGAPATWYGVNSSLDKPEENTWYICALTDGEEEWSRPMLFKKGKFIIPEDHPLLQAVANKQVYAWTKLPCPPQR